MNRFQTGVLTLTACCLPIAGSVSAQSPALPVIPTNTFRVDQYGAVGDGKTMNTMAIQKTVERLPKLEVEIFCPGRQVSHRSIYARQLD